MATRLNRQWLLASRPEGMVQEANFTFREAALPQIQDGQILVRVLFLSFDPAMRGWMTDRPSYIARRGFLIAATFILTFLTVACGYLSSGKWEDDPQNWKRAWGYSKPDDVVMLHSWYWRSAHWTREEAYYFHFRWHEELFNQLIARNKMNRIASSQGSEPQYCFERPAWFAPKRIDTYEIWRCGASSNCWLFRDTETKEIFLFACQL